MKKKLLSYQIRLKIVVSIMIMGIILLFSVFIFNFLLRQLKLEEYNNALQILNTQSAKIEMYIDNLDTILKRIATEKNLQETLLNFEPNENIPQQRQTINQIITNETLFSNAEKLDIYIWDEEKNLRYPFTKNVVDNSLFYHYKDRINIEKEYMFIISDNANNKIYFGKEGLSIIRQIYNVKTGRYIGYVEIYVPREDFEEIINVSNLKICIYKREGLIIYPYELIDEVEQNYMVWNEHSDIENIYLNKEICAGQYMMSVFYEENQIYQTFSLGEEMSILLIFLAITVSSLLVIVYGKFILKPIENVRKYIQKISMTNEVLDIENEIYDKEFQVFIETFNEMMSRINESKKNELNAIKQIERARYEAFHAQISPHFMQNVLFDLQIMIMENDMDSAYNMCSKLSYMLRYGMNIKATEVPIKKELEYIHNYLDMYKLQYNNDFEYKIMCEDSLEDVLIPKLSLQPLVENSIKHGLYNKEQGKWKINIECFQYDQEIVICVEDNGCGMTEELLVFYQDYAEMEKCKDCIMKDEDILSGIGISNTICRWKYLYGNQIKIYFTNETPGLKITFKIKSVQKYTHNSSI